MSKLVTLEPGQVFAGEYTVVRPLAEGGMGAVYVVLQKSTGHERALKIMHPQLVADPAFRTRFEREACIGAKIDSDHVVQVVAAGVDEPTSTPWMAMELLRGETLEHWVQRRSPIARDTVRELVEQLRHGLAAAHAQNIVHRDLKPENIFVAESRSPKSPFTLKVLDFGVSRIILENQTAATVTTAIGSPAWMAPEQGTAGAHIRPATDVWALGLIGFFMLTGRPYWLRANDAFTNLQALLVEVMVEPIVAPSERARALGVPGPIPQGFDGWFARCVVRDPEQRFREAGECLGDLLTLLAAPAPVAPVARTVPMEAVSIPTVPPVAPTQFGAPVPPQGPFGPTLSGAGLTSSGPPWAPPTHLPLPPQPPTQTPPLGPTQTPEKRPAKPDTTVTDFAVPGVLFTMLMLSGVVYAYKHRPAANEPAESAPAESTTEPEHAPTEAPLVETPRNVTEAQPSSPDPRGGSFSLDAATEGLPQGSALFATLDTSMGPIRCRLFDVLAPNTVANFVGLARARRDFWDPEAARWTRARFYDGSIFHRVIAGFMIQGGDWLRSGRGGVGYTIDDENTHGHDRAGLLCMANRGPNTNGGQFFITDGAAPHLEGSYSIFGDCAPTSIVSQIAQTPKGENDRPLAPVFIQRVHITRE